MSRGIVRGIAFVALALIAVGAGSAAGSEGAASAGESEFRAAWLSLAASGQGGSDAQSPGAWQEARIAALGHMEAAVEAEPENAVYQAALAYVALAAGKYARAKDAVTRAIELRPKDPFFHLLRGQAEAALAQMEPDKAGERSGPALRALDDAAQLDGENALALLQGASVAFDLGRGDLALPRVREALERPGLVLYSLSVPFDLHPGRKASIDAWHQVQYGQWMDVLARCHNVSRALLRMGQQEEADRDLAAAEAYFRDALGVARMVGMSAPNLFIATHTGINMMEEAYGRLAMSAARAMVSEQFAELNPSPAEQANYLREWWEGEPSANRMDNAPRDVHDLRWTFEALDSFYTWLVERRSVSATEKKAERDRWRGEMGVLQIGRAQLYDSLQVHLKELSDNPPGTVEELLAMEAERVERVVRGIGLTPTADRETPPGGGGD